MIAKNLICRPFENFLAEYFLQFQKTVNVFEKLNELVTLVPESKQQKAGILLNNVLNARKISKLGNVFVFMQSMSGSNQVSDVTNLIPKEQKAPPPRVKNEPMVRVWFLSILARIRVKFSGALFFVEIFFAVCFSLEKNGFSLEVESFSLEIKWKLFFEK